MNQQASGRAENLETSAETLRRWIIDPHHHQSERLSLSCHASQSTREPKAPDCKLRGFQLKCF